MIPQVLCTVVTSSQAPSQVVPKAPGGKYFSVAEWGKGTALTWYKPAPKGECSALPAPSHPSPKGKLLLDGEKKRGSQIPAVKCLQRAVGNLLDSEQLSQCLCFGQEWPPWIQQGEGCSHCLPQENLHKSIIELLQAQASKHHWSRVSNTSLSTNNTATEIYVFFCHLISVFQIRECWGIQLNAMPWLYCCRFSSLSPYSSMPRGIFSLNPLYLSGLLVTCLWSSWWTPSQDLSLLLQSSWGSSLHYSSDNPTHGTCGMTLWSISPLLFLPKTHSKGEDWLIILHSVTYEKQCGAESAVQMRSWQI